MDVTRIGARFQPTPLETEVWLNYLTLVVGYIRPSRVVDEGFSLSSGPVLIHVSTRRSHQLEQPVRAGVAILCQPIQIAIRYVTALVP